MILHTRADARAGLLGNPSDGYFGKTISIIVKNFSASVTLWESPELHIEPTERDGSTFRSIAHLCEEVRRFGYYAGIRLLKATVRRFADYCDKQGVALPKRNFTVRYSSTIPRHVGLGGSSAIITAFLRALCRFYGVEIPLEIVPNLALSVETEELGISAGLQDRVIQAYEGVVYMDFDRAYMEQHGHGRYERLDPALLPPLFLAYRTDLSEGSEVFHNNVRARFNRGDPEVVQAMKDFASYAERGRDLLVAGRGAEIGPLMDANFDRRSSIYPISEKNREMVEAGRRLGAHVKFSGSGGAVIGTLPDEEAYPRLEAMYRALGVQVVRPRIV